MRYGLPYQGSKNKIAKDIIDALPPAEHFYDLFGGGCAITHAALLSGKYKYVHANDISDAPKLFLDAINGKYKNESRWISREDFFKLKDTDLYVKLCWSFGNNGNDYLYSKEVEPWKKAYHFAKVKNDYSLIREFYNMPELPYDKFRMHITAHHEEIKTAYIEWYKKTYFKGKTSEIEEIKADIVAESERLRNYLIEHRNRAGMTSSDVDRYLGTKGMAGHYYGKSQWEFPTLEVYEKLRPVMNWTSEYPITYFLAQRLQRLQNLQDLQSLESLERLQRLQRLQSLESLERLQSLQRLTVTQCDYRNIHIEKDSVIYCDIPYINTAGYNGDKKGNSFDHNSFYEWALKQKNIFVSEYTMPDTFQSVWSKEKRKLMRGALTTGKAVENIFIPKTQEKITKTQSLILRPWKQLEFDFT